jgi:hypothetical protein
MNNTASRQQKATAATNHGTNQRRAQRQTTPMRQGTLASKAQQSNDGPLIHRSIFDPSNLTREEGRDR